MYIINGSEISKVGMGQGITSDVILRIKKDEARVRAADRLR